ncbi:MAG: hypothetical protein ACOYB0_08230 [Polynucleobacter sp.]
MAGILTRLLFGKFPRGFSHWDTPQGMNENLRAIDDHLFIPADRVQSSGTALPTGATNGYTVIEINTGKMFVWFDGAFTAYEPRRGKVAVSAIDLWYCTGSQWESLGARVAAALQSFDPAALATFCEAVRACPVGTRLLDCNGTELAEGESVSTCAQTNTIATNAAANAVANGITIGNGHPGTTPPVAGKLPLYVDRSATPDAMYLYTAGIAPGSPGTWTLIGDGNDSGADALRTVYHDADLSGDGTPGNPLSVNFPVPPTPGIQFVTVAPGDILYGNGTPANPLNISLPNICAWLSANCAALITAAQTTFTMVCYGASNTLFVVLNAKSPSPGSFLIQHWDGAAWQGVPGMNGGTINTSSAGAPPGAPAFGAASTGPMNLPGDGWYRLASLTAGVPWSEPTYIALTCPDLNAGGGG